MGLLDDIGREQDKSQPNRCPVAKVRALMEPDDLKDFEAALVDHTLRHVAIARAVTARGYPLSEKGVAAHRNETCGCARR